MFSQSIPKNFTRSILHFLTASALLLSLSVPLHAAPEAILRLDPGGHPAVVLPVVNQRTIDVRGATGEQLQVGLVRLDDIGNAQLDLGPEGIRVNILSAGPIKTLSSSAIKGLNAKLALQERISPLRRQVTGEDVGKAATFLLSDHASGVTGEILHVDCGFHALGSWEDPPE